MCQSPVPDLAKAQYFDTMNALDAFLFELTEMDDLDMEFSPCRWNAIVDHMTVHSDGRLVFRFQNGSDVTVMI